MSPDNRPSQFRFNYSALASVSVGVDAASALAGRVLELRAQRVFILGSASLSRVTGTFADFSAALEGRVVGVFDRIGAHSPRQDVLSALAAARAADADLLVAIGGGSIIDACKVVQLALNQELHTEAELLEYAQFSDGTRGAKSGDYSLFTAPSRVRQIAIPTTLSGAEYSNNAGVLDTAKSAKEGYRGLDLCPQHILYDPALGRHTPEWLWLSTAIRSLDHAVEGYCSADSTGFLDGHFLHALRLFAESLPQTRANPEALAPRSLNQQAVWLACCGLGTVAHGASHGMGYILGSLCGVPHGYTSCVLLPAVLQWNAAVNGERQQALAEALGRPDTDAATAVRDLVRSLGLPTSLREVGVAESQFEEIARRASRHPVVRNNPRAITGPAQCEEILQLAR
jgi:maleylacetate reductase